MNTKPLLLFALATVIIAALFYAVTVGLASTDTSTTDDVSVNSEDSQSDNSTDISLTSAPADEEKETITTNSNNEEDLEKTSADTKIAIPADNSHSSTQNTSESDSPSNANGLITYIHESGVTVKHPTDWTYQFFKDFDGSKQFYIEVTAFDEVPETGAPYGDDKETYQAEAAAIHAGEDIALDDGSFIPVISFASGLSAKHWLNGHEGTVLTERYTFYTDTHKVMLFNDYEAYLAETDFDLFLANTGIAEKFTQNHAFTQNAPEELRTRSAQLRAIAESIDLSALQ